MQIKALYVCIWMTTVRLVMLVRHFVDACLFIKLFAWYMHMITRAITFDFENNVAFS